MSNKWIAIIGSPRKGKNTELITDYIIEALNKKNIIVDKYYLDSINNSPCTACEYCIRAGVCNINDDLSKIIDMMKRADGYIFTSPSYNYNVTSQMKALLDRTFSLNDYGNGGWKSRLNPDKKAIIVGVCAGKDRDCMGYTMEAMRKPLDELGVKIADMIEYYNTKHMPVIKNNEIKENILWRISSNEEI